MKVLILTNHLREGGLSRYVVNLASGLKNLSCRVWVGSCGGKWENLLHQAGINHKYLPLKTKSILSLRVFASLFMLVNFAKREKIDIIHANTRVTQFLAFLLSCLTKRKYVSAFHGFYRPHKVRKRFKFYGNLAIAVSFAVKEHLINDLKIPEEKIRVIYNGIDSKKFLRRLRPAEAKKKFGLNEDETYIGILGRISQEKGHLLALRAFKEISAQYPKVKLLISGSGKKEKDVKDFINRNQLEEKVKILDLNSSDFLEIIDLLVMPSSKEGFGFSIIEAAAKKVPVIGYATGGIKELINDGKSGILFYEYNPQALACAIKSLLDDCLQAQVLADEAFKKTEEFSLAKMAENTLKVYEEALGQ